MGVMLVYLQLSVMVGVATCLEKLAVTFPVNIITFF